MYFYLPTLAPGIYLVRVVARLSFSLSLSYLSTKPRSRCPCEKQQIKIDKGTVGASLGRRLETRPSLLRGRNICTSKSTGNGTCFPNNGYLVENSAEERRPELHFRLIKGKNRGRGNNGIRIVTSIMLLPRSRYSLQECWPNSEIEI